MGAKIIALELMALVVFGVVLWRELTHLLR
jgi:hypothetical protein